MKDLLASREVSPAGCALGGCLLVLVAGGLYSLLMSSGGGVSQKFWERRGLEPPVATGAPPTPLPRRPEPSPPRPPSPAPPARREESPSPPPPRREPTLCERILDSVPGLADCTVLDTGDPRGPTLFVTLNETAVGGSDDNASMMALTVMDHLPAGAPRPGAISVETSSAAYVLSTKGLEACREQPSPIACVRSGFTRFSKK